MCLPTLLALNFLCSQLLQSKLVHGCDLKSCSLSFLPLRKNSACVLFAAKVKSNLLKSTIVVECLKFVSTNRTMQQNALWAFLLILRYEGLRMLLKWEYPAECQSSDGFDVFPLPFCVIFKYTHIHKYYQALLSRFLSFAYTLFLNIQWEVSQLQIGWSKTSSST